MQQNSTLGSSMLSDP